MYAGKEAVSGGFKVNVPGTLPGHTRRENSLMGSLLLLTPGTCENEKKSRRIVQRTPLYLGVCVSDNLFNHHSLLLAALRLMVDVEKRA